MKKVSFWVALIACIMLLAAACESLGDGNKSDDAKYKSIYDKYKSGLILDGASKYVVKKGDTLSNISRVLYQDPYYYPVIMMASSDIVLDPDKIEPGMQLTVPNLQANLNNANARSNIKRLLLEFADLEESRDRAGTAQGMRDRSNSL